MKSSVKSHDALIKNQNKTNRPTSKTPTHKNTDSCTKVVVPGGCFAPYITVDAKGKTTCLGNTGKQHDQPPPSPGSPDKKDND